MKNCAVLHFDWWWRWLAVDGNNRMCFAIAKYTIARVESISRFFIVILVDALFDAVRVKFGREPLPITFTRHRVSITQIKLEVAVLISADVPFSG